MVVWALLSVLALTAVGAAHESRRGQSQPAASQPSSQPSESRGVLRKPPQAEILEALIRDRERAARILPTTPEVRAGSRPRAVGDERGPESATLLLDGTMIIERPGRATRVGERWEIEFRAETGETPVLRMQLLENQLLEVLEEQIERGASEFVVTAEVTRYAGRNYLLLRKVLRRVSNSNTSP